MLDIRQATVETKQWDHEVLCTMIMSEMSNMSLVAEVWRILPTSR